jgi:hypothetical protein
MSEQLYFKDFTDLAFCQHHANEHHAVLLALGWERLTTDAQPIDNRTLVPVE